MIKEPEVKHKFFFVTPDLPFVNIPVMEIHELRSLTALAESRSLAAVAQRLHLSPAAIHKHFRARWKRSWVFRSTRGSDAS